MYNTKVYLLYIPLKFRFRTLHKLLYYLLYWSVPGNWHRWTASNKNLWHLLRLQLSNCQFSFFSDSSLLHRITFIYTKHRIVIYGLFRVEFRWLISLLIGKHTTSPYFKSLTEINYYVHYVFKVNISIYFTFLMNLHVCIN